MGENRQYISTSDIKMFYCARSQKYPIVLGVSDVEMSHCIETSKVKMCLCASSQWWRIVPRLVMSKCPTMPRASQLCWNILLCRDNASCVRSQRNVEMSHCARSKRCPIVLGVSDKMSHCAKSQWCPIVLGGNILWSVLLYREQVMLNCPIMPGAINVPLCQEPAYCWNATVCWQLGMSHYAKSMRCRNIPLCRELEMPYCARSIVLLKCLIMLGSSDIPLCFDISISKWTIVSRVSNAPLCRELAMPHYAGHII